MSSKRYVKKHNYKGPKKSVKLNPIQKKEVKNILYKNLELKSFDVGGNPTVSSAPSITKWFSIPQGTGNSQRIANEITASHIMLSYSCLVGDAQNTIRFILFQWHDDDLSATPTAADILFLASSNDYTNAMYSFDNRDKFKILYDKRHRVEASGPGSVALAKNYRVKVPHKTISYNGGGALTGKNMIYQLLVSDSTLTPHPTVMNCGRLLYRDA